MKIFQKCFWFSIMCLFNNFNLYKGNKKENFTSVSIDKAFYALRMEKFLPKIQNSNFFTVDEKTNRKDINFA